ncbi:MAG: HAD family phosphatase [Alphaproteobacteria bacterium]|nr:HAD family phosphatase [Alphaproteobacteria bacterium]
MSITAILFDCDGVLADSEGLVNALVAEELTARGWAMTADECRARFIGQTLPMMLPAIEARTGRVPPGWVEAIYGRVVDLLAEALEPVPGALEAVAAMQAAGYATAVGSNSSRAELAVKMRRLGLAGRLAGRVVSYQDVAAPKPAPDIWFECARRCAAAPGGCIVVEDSVLGLGSARAAGMRAIGFAAEGHDAAADALHRAGAVSVLRRLADLPAALGALAGRG